MSHVQIIGAGPAGLTAALELSKLGVSASVLEADLQVGGLSRTVNYHGYRFDIGGHRFFSKVPLINELWQEILGEELLTRRRLSRIYYRGRFFDYPIKAVNALTGLGPPETLRVALSYARAKLFPSDDETNFEQWVSNRFGQRLYEIFFKTYTEKVWGIPCTEISADWAAQRIKNLSLHEAVSNALFGSSLGKDGNPITSLIESFSYPRLGPGMMWESCERLLAGRGVETFRGVKIQKVRHRNGLVESIVGLTAAGEVAEFEGDHFISTMPLSRLIQSLEPSPPDHVLEAANRLRYRDYLTVALVLNRASVFPDNWLYVHSPKVKVGRIQNYKNWSPDMVPDTSRTSLGLEYFLWNEDEMWRWSDERLMDLGVSECAQIGLIDPREVEDGTVIRMKRAYPIYDLGYRDSLTTIRRYLETLSNLQTIGRNGLHRYNNQDHSMLTGIYAARNIAGQSFDVWSVNTETEYHEKGGASHVLLGDRLVPLGIIPKEPLSSADVINVVFAELDPIAMGVAIGAVSGFGLFLATAVLLIKGGPVVGPNLSLLAQYLIGFSVTWLRALVGLAGAGLVGFIIGYVAAWLRNRSMTAYAYLLRRRAQAEADEQLLDKV